MLHCGSFNSVAIVCNVGLFQGKKTQNTKNSCTHTQSCVILEGLNNAVMEEFLSPCSFECVIACLGAAVWCYTFGSMKWEAFIGPRAALSRQSIVKSHFHSNQLMLTQNNAAGAAAWRLEHHPQPKRGGGKREVPPHDCYFYHRHFSHCLSARLSDLSLPQPLLSIPLS